MEDSVYENTAFRAERVEAKDNSETEEPQEGPQEKFTFSLPNVVADCIEADFAVIPSEIPPDKVITNDRKTETVSAIVHKEPNPTPGSYEQETRTLFNAESAQEEITDDVSAGINEQEKLSSEIEIILLEIPFELSTIEELPEDEANHESVQLEVNAHEKAQVGHVIQDIRHTTAEVHAEEIPEAALEALCQEFATISAAPLEEAADTETPLEEELIVATVFAPLSGEQEARLSLPGTTEMLENTVEFPVEALSEKQEAVEEVPTQENLSAAEAPSEDAQVLESFDAAVEDCEQQLKTQTLEPSENEAIAQEADRPSEVLSASDEPAEAVLEAIVEEIIREEAEDPSESEEEEEEAGNESHMDSPKRSNMEALLIRLHSACLSVVKESSYIRADVAVSSLGHSITVSIHVDPSGAQQQ